MNNTTNFYGNINNSQIQQNANNSYQNLNISENYEKKDELLEWLNSTFQENINQIKLENSTLEIINSSIKSIKSELIKDNSNKNIVNCGLSTIKNILEGVTGSIIASGLIYQLGLFI